MNDSTAHVGGAKIGTTFRTKPPQKMTRNTRSVLSNSTISLVPSTLAHDPPSEYYAGLRLPLVKAGCCKRSIRQLKRQSMNHRIDSLFKELHQNKRER